MPKLNKFNNFEKLGLLRNVSWNLSYEAFWSVVNKNPNAMQGVT